MLGIAANRVIFATVNRITRHSHNSVLAAFARYGENPVQLILALAVTLAVLPVLPLPPSVAHGVQHVVGLGLIACVGWMLIALVQVFDDLISVRHSSDIHLNFAARRLRTQVQMLRRVAGSVIVVVTIAIMLMTFPEIRHIGESMLASAGLAALIAGFAARSTLSNLAAGIQIALTQPIRLEDAVVVEGEWGWIEEIRITYVVVRIWDLRRLVVPVAYFIEKPFQNWTRNTFNLLATAFVYADYSVPVDVVREELHHILGTTDLWDGRTWGLQVTNCTDRTIELRALMSAADSQTSWDLRCYVREKLILFLQREHPESLPRTRAEVAGVADDARSSRHAA